MSTLDSERVLAFIADNPGCGITDVARGVFNATTGRRTPEGQAAYTKAAFEIRVLEVTQDVRSEIDPETTRKRLYVDLPDETVNDENLDPRLVLVRMSKRQLFLIRHIMRRGLQDGYLGEPTRSTLEHLDTESDRIERAHPSAPRGRRRQMPEPPPSGDENKTW